MVFVNESHRVPIVALDLVIFASTVNDRPRISSRVRGRRATARRKAACGEPLVSSTSWASASSASPVQDRAPRCPTAPTTVAPVAAALVAVHQVVVLAARSFRHQASTATATGKAPACRRSRRRLPATAGPTPPHRLATAGRRRADRPHPDPTKVVRGLCATECRPARATGLALQRPAPPRRGPVQRQRAGHDDTLSTVGLSNRTSAAASPLRTAHSMVAGQSGRGPRAGQCQAVTVCGQGRAQPGRCREQSGLTDGQYLAVSLVAGRPTSSTYRRGAAARAAAAGVGPAAAAARGAEVRDFSSPWERAAPHIRAAPGSARLRAPPRHRYRAWHWAGAWTATGWPATMEGAVRSGLAAADVLLGQSTVESVSS